MTSRTAAKTEEKSSSTPTWPVPYYQRAFRHPANLDKAEGDLGYFLCPVDDSHVMMAKEFLKMEGKGYVVVNIKSDDPQALNSTRVCWNSLSSRRPPRTDQSLGAAAVGSSTGVEGEIRKE